MRIRDGVYLAAKELRHRRRRASVLLVTSALAFALLAILGGWAAGYQSLLKHSAQGNLIEVLIHLPQTDRPLPPVTGIRLPPSQNPLPEKALIPLRRTVAGKQVVYGLALWQQTAGGFATIIGLDRQEAKTHSNAKHDPQVLSIRDPLSSWISKGRTLQQDGEAILESHYAKMGRLKTGDVIRLGNADLRVVGVYEKKGALAGTLPEVLIGLQDARRLAGVLPDCVNAAYVQVATADLPELRRSLASAELAVLANDPAGQIFGDFREIASWFLLAGRIALPLFAALLLAVTVWWYLSENGKTVATLRAIGWTRREVRDLLLVEVILLSAVALLLGGGGILISGMTGNQQASDPTVKQAGQDARAPILAAEDEPRTPALSARTTTANLLVSLLVVLAGTISGCGLAARRLLSGGIPQLLQKHG